MSGPRAKLQVTLVMADIRRVSWRDELHLRHNPVKSCGQKRNEFELKVRKGRYSRRRLVQAMTIPNEIDIFELAQNMLYVHFASKVFEHPSEGRKY